MRMLVTGPRGFVGARIMAACPGAVPAPSPQEPVSRIKSRIREACSWVLYWARKI